ncbi:acetoacetate decarboxylase [Massilia sp. PWRC2]|uniref:acetoacetate decarboxylase n=1 Tax=Massilia sp. PWRC2 TaxID=2804626 RepID=UPI003CEEFD7E
MKHNDVLHHAFSMPLDSPSYPRGPYRFIDREYLIISFRTDPHIIAAALPEPLQPRDDAIVKFEVIRMPDSTGFGDYTESGLVIPARLQGQDVGYVHSMFLDDEAPIAAGREIWGFPKKLAQPKMEVRTDTLIGELSYAGSTIARATMGYKYQGIDHRQAAASLAAPAVLLKIVPHVDGTPRICELNQYQLEDIHIKGAWSGPGALQLFDHALAPLARFPVLEVVSAVHILADLTLPYGTVVYDYLN